jgi:hypothetical protein
MPKNIRAILLESAQTLLFKDHRATAYISGATADKGCCDIHTVIILSGITQSHSARLLDTEHKRSPILLI